MEWTDDGIILFVRPHGETSAIVSLLAREHGRYAALVFGGQGRKAQSLLQIGNKVSAQWRARVLDQLGHYTLDLIEPFPAMWLDDAEPLLIIETACSMTEASLPERQPMSNVFEGILALFSLKDKELWGASYVKWEVNLLTVLGYGLDLTRCAVSGVQNNLTHVSPRTGRAVCADEAAPYKEKLLPIPGFLLGKGDVNATSISQGLALTGHFFSRHVFANPHNRALIPRDGDLPLARQRLADFYRHRAEIQENT
jgi:DNA repair protein RecO (recombination protein O)